ncbi:MAG: hypothetical protein GY822_06985 [Deltaproteobacteria bacterium]|nr:hypothetical protein [Deltaproteobacteria bacterium]
MKTGSWFLFFSFFLVACDGPSVSENDGDDAGVLFVDAGSEHRDAGLQVHDAGEHISASDAGEEIPLVDEECLENGCLREVRWVGDYAKSVLEDVVSPDVTLQNGYSIWRVRFFTDGREARASVAIPYALSPEIVAQPEGGFHVVMNLPGTVGVADSCALGNGILGSALAGLFGARGAIGAALDYPGLGSPGTHPYLVAESEAHASLDAARAVLHLATRESVATSGRVAMVGLSQGGHAVLSAAAAHASYAPDVDVKAFAAVGPASMYFEHWTPSLLFFGEHLVYHALLIWAWSKHYEYAGPSLWSPALENDIDDVMEQSCLFSQTGEPTLFEALSEVSSGEEELSADRLFSPDFLTAFGGGDLTSFPIFSGAFDVNRVRPFVQTAPLLLYQGDSDSVVLKSSTDELVAALRAGDVEVDYRVVSGGQHTNIAFGFVANAELRTEESVQWIFEQLDVD